MPASEYLNAFHEFTFTESFLIFLFRHSKHRVMNTAHYRRCTDHNHLQQLLSPLNLPSPTNWPTPAATATARADLLCFAQCTGRVLLRPAAACARQRQPISYSLSGRFPSQAIKGMTPSPHIALACACVCLHWCWKVFCE